MKSIRKYNYMKIKPEATRKELDKILLDIANGLTLKLTMFLRKCGFPGVTVRIHLLRSSSGGVDEVRARIWVRYRMTSEEDIAKGKPREMKSVISNLFDGLMHDNKYDFDYFFVNNFADLEEIANKIDMYSEMDERAILLLAKLS